MKKIFSTVKKAFFAGIDAFIPGTIFFALSLIILTPVVIVFYLVAVIAASSPLAAVSIVSIFAVTAFTAYKLV